MTVAFRTWNDGMGLCRVEEEKRVRGMVNGRERSVASVLGSGTVTSAVGNEECAMASGT
jgi:hypothetical protein